MPVAELSLIMRDHETLPERLRGVDSARGIALWGVIAASLGMGATPLNPVWPYLIFFAGTLLLTTSAMTAGYARLTGQSWLSLTLRTAILLIILTWSDMALRSHLPMASAELLPAGLVMTWIGACLYALPSLVLTIGAVTLFGGGLALHMLADMLFLPQAFPAGEAGAAAWKDIVRQWAVAGWFPLVPYLSFTLFGTVLLRLIAFHPGRIFRSPPASRLAALFFATGIAAHFLLPPATLFALGDNIIHLPPTLSLFLLTAGSIIVIGMLAELCTFISLSRITEVTGRIAFFLLLLHGILMASFLRAYLDQNPALHWFVFAAEVIGFAFLAFAWDYLSFAYQEMRKRAGLAVA